MADLVKRLTKRSTDGLFEKTSPRGGYGVNLEEGFQSVPLAKLDMHGDTVVGCVTSLPEANGFFGRDLETGAPVPVAPAHDVLASQAAAHEMSTDEYQFYSNLVAEAAAIQQMNPQSATLAIVNADAAGEGFNDPAPRTPEGGNTGTTLGEQRLILFNFAASIWGAFLDSGVEIKVRSRFDPLTPCSTSGGVLGQAGALEVYRDFPGAELPGTWYPVALANKRSGTDLNVAQNDISATFNSSVDNGCLGVGTRYYYGLDNSRPSGTINLLVVLLHEMGHGLGFQTFANGSTGALFGGMPDTYSRYMFDRTTGKYWYEMTDAERRASALNAGNLLWDGPNVRANSQSLSLGREMATGRVQLYAPSTYQGGSSISHWDTASSPNLLMEPNITSGLPLNLDLTRQHMRDLGWYRDTNADLTPDTIANVTPSGSSLVMGSTAAIGWTNEGNFGRNVTIELSTDGGSSFTTIASDVANTGSYTFQVPNEPTTQGRIRVREAGFVTPSGMSSVNFSITDMAAPFVTVAGRITAPDGRGLRNAIVSITDTQGVTRTTLTSSFGLYSFSDVPAGRTHTVRVASKRFRFTAQSITPASDLTTLDFVGSE